jgi:cytochrome c553
MLKRVSLTAFGAGFRFALACGVAYLALVHGTLLPLQAAEDIEAKVQMCGACHGENGVPVDPKTVPVIWGQQQSYLVKQLHDYRSGDRESPIMSPIARSLAQEDLRKIAAFFAARSWPAQHASASAASTSPPDGIAQCQPCHQPKFEGGAPAPRLAGLSYEYLVAAMRGFASGERTNNGDMPKFMQALTDSERDAMARYLSGL